MVTSYATFSKYPKYPLKTNAIITSVIKVLYICIYTLISLMATSSWKYSPDSDWCRLETFSADILVLTTMDKIEFVTNAHVNSC